MKTLQELIELSRHYFELKPELQCIYATEDNQFFYPEHKNCGVCHASSNKLQMFTITREMLEVKQEPQQKVVEKQEIKEVKEVKKTKKLNKNGLK